MRHTGHREQIDMGEMMRKPGTLRAQPTIMAAAEIRQLREQLGGTQVRLNMVGRHSRLEFSVGLVSADQGRNP